MSAYSTHRPPDHTDSPEERTSANKLGPSGWVRWAWTSLTSMRTALVLLLILAIAAIPGSLVPQRTSDPNGVVAAYRDDRPRAELLEALGLFEVYTSPWFSAVYILLFLSLMGCLIQRMRFHVRALRQPPPRTPSRLARFPTFRVISSDPPVTQTAIADRAVKVLRSAGYRVATYTDGRGQSVSAERGYIKETGNLVFHGALVLVLVAIAAGGGFSYAGQRVVIEGQSFVNGRSSYDSFRSGVFFSDSQLSPFALTLTNFDVEYVENDSSTLGFITDYRADVRVVSGSQDVADRSALVRVNEPLNVSGSEIYLLGNGYAPEIIVRNASGAIVYADAKAFLPQDSNLTSLGVLKLPDGLGQQVGLLGFFYPTGAMLESGALTSVYPDVQNPVLTLNVFVGDLGIDTGTPRSVYALDTSSMTQLTGGDTGVDSIELTPGETATLPDGMGSIEFVDVRRFASFDVAFDPTKTPVFIAVAAAVAGLLCALFVPRRRIWVRPTAGGFEIAGLSRGDDGGLGPEVDRLAVKVTSSIDRID